MVYRPWHIGYTQYVIDLDQKILGFKKIKLKAVKKLQVLH